MTATSRRRDVRAVTDVAVAALETSGADTLPQVLDAVTAAVGADGCVLVSHSPERIRVEAHLPVRNEIPMHEAPTDHALGLSPALRLFVTHRPESVFALTDCCTVQQWQAHELAALLRPAWGLSLQLAIPVAMGRDRISALVLSRATGDYSPDDRDVATAIQPVLDVVVRHHASLATVPAPRGASTLTSRELVVLTLVGRGLSARAIGRRLGISPRTVQKHLEHVYRKLDVRDRLLAVQRAVAAGLVPVAPPAGGPADARAPGVPRCP